MIRQMNLQHLQAFVELNIGSGCSLQCPACAWLAFTFRVRAALFLRLCACNILFTGKAFLVGDLIPGRIG